jgi:hypothetical protein
MYIDVEIDPDTAPEDTKQEATDTVQRVIEEGMPFIGEGGIEVVRVEEI